MRSRQRFNKKYLLQTRLALQASLVFICSSCVVQKTERVPNQQPKLILPDQDTFAVIDQMYLGSKNQDAGEEEKSYSFLFEKLCSVTYDGFTLPIFAPKESGDLFALQVGKRPSDKTLTAVRDQSMGEHAVSIQKVTPTGTPEIITTHSGAFILGRNGNDEGVLIEEPKPDGSRSIALAGWGGEPLKWLVDDGAVNAFGWITQSGRLLYSTREIGETNFRLKVMERDGTSWEIPESLPYSWILPTFSKDGSGIFAVRMGDGYGDLIWGLAENPGDFRNSMQTLRISDRLNPQIAWQGLSSTTGGQGIYDEEIAWFCFEEQRMMLWNGMQDSIRVFPEETVACTHLTASDEWLITTLESLECLHFLDGAMSRKTLLSDPWITRRSSGDTNLIVKANGDSLEIGELKFDVKMDTTKLIEGTDEEKIQVEKLSEPEYEYNIRD